MDYHKLVNQKLAWVLALPIDPSVFWPYAAGAVILVIGLTVVMRGPVRRAQGLDKLAAFGPTLFGIAMAVFGADHFVGASFVARIVPSWIPWHLFWTYFVGTALIAGAFSFATTIQWRLAAASFVIMLLTFELTIHLPNLFAAPHDRLRLTLVLPGSFPSWRDAWPLPRARRARLLHQGRGPAPYSHRSSERALSLSHVFCWQYRSGCSG